MVYFVDSNHSPEKRCEGCLRATDWSSDETALLVFGESPYQIKLLNLASHKQTPVLRHKKYSLLYGRFSPDNRWISFTVRVSSNLAKIAIAPLNEAKPVPESAWIIIADVALDDYTIWSPDGKTLYFTSPQDGITAYGLGTSIQQPVGLLGKSSQYSISMDGSRSATAVGWQQVARSDSLSLRQRAMFGRCRNNEVTVPPFRRPAAAVWRAPLVRRFLLPRQSSSARPCHECDPPRRPAFRCELMNLSVQPNPMSSTASYQLHSRRFMDIAYCGRSFVKQ